MSPRRRPLQVKQVNCFYNYTLGLDYTEVDLLRTAATLLKSGLARTVCFSDLKAVYLDEKGDAQVEWIRPTGRAWDNRWSVKFSQALPSYVVEELIFCLELSFHEQHIEGVEAKQVPPHLRAALPPVVLEHEDLSLPIYPWLKLHADGIICLSFQLDTTWEGLNEQDFIQDIVNLFQRYFDQIWVHADIQRMDAEQLIPDAFEGDVAIGGQDVVGRKARKLVKEMRKKAQGVLDASLGQDARRFDMHGGKWNLHPIAGSEDQKDWEATIDLCRSIYANAVAQVTALPGKKVKHAPSIQMWQGRPSISLMRFKNQPKSKDILLTEFGPSLSRILMRSGSIADPPPLPRDLRAFEDYSFHGNRAILLWTWLRLEGSPNDAWTDGNTRAQLLENQARAEHVEYHNMRVARACATASYPPSDRSLVHAYRTLTNAASVIHQSSQAGEITDALEFLMHASGTLGLIDSGKEQARWHLEERRYRNEKSVLAWIGGWRGFSDLSAQRGWQIWWYNHYSRPIIHAGPIGKQDW